MKLLQGLLIGCLATLGAATGAHAGDAAAPGPNAPEAKPTEPEGVRGTAVDMDGVAFAPE